MPVIKERQTITDIAVQYAGDAGMAMAIAMANGLSVSDDVEAGTYIIIPSVANKEVANFFEVNNQAPAMRDGINEELDGIDYMEIGLDFIVR